MQSDHRHRCTVSGILYMEAHLLTHINRHSVNIKMHHFSIKRRFGFTDRGRSIPVPLRGFLIFISSFYLHTHTRAHIHWKTGNDHTVCLLSTFSVISFFELLTQNSRQGPSSNVSNITSYCSHCIDNQFFPNKYFLVPYYFHITFRLVWSLPCLIYDSWNTFICRHR